MWHGIGDQWQNPVDIATNYRIPEEAFSFLSD
jgi:hypothetical protein